VIKSINGDRDPDSLARLVEASSSRDDIIVMDGYVAPEQQNALIASCDCYVSLHRSEGFGFTMAEAMMYERPVIATGHGGNTTFMSEENSFLVPYRLVPISSAAKPYPAEGEWADPDIDEAARLMRHVHDSPEEAVAVAERGRLHVSTHHTPSLAGRFAAARLKEISLVRAAHRAREIDPGAEAAASLPPLVRARLRLAEGAGSGFVGAPSRGAPVALLRRAIRRLVWPYLAHQHAINEALFEAVRTLEGAHHERNVRLARIEAMLDVDNLSSTRDRSTERLDRLEAELLPRPYMSDPMLLELDVNGQTAIGYANGDRPTNEGVYLGFEDIFRGPEDFIRARQRYYVKLVKDSQPVLDVGCGRGEFLDLMREHGIAARGIDLLPEMIQHAQAKGNDVEIAEANAYLEAQPDASLGAVFSAQVIEHLSYDELLRFLTLARRKLRPGGILIAETVNPHSLSALKMFWVDPTHVSPIFPEVAAALAGLHGYASATIVFPNGTGSLERDRRECGEYALVARKESGVERSAPTASG
jgi:SAM-dependent methyltransferase